MAASKKYRGEINFKNLDEWLHSTGFLFPKNETQLARFNRLYADYDFKLKDVRIDVKSIIDGSVCFNTRIFRIIEDEDINKEIGELKMVARKGQEIPKQVIDKMRKKHRKDDGDKEQ